MNDGRGTILDSESEKLTARSPLSPEGFSLEILGLDLPLSGSLTAIVELVVQDRHRELGPGGAIRRAALRLRPVTDR